ncbi:hypothetical protein CN934_19285 [Ensifer sp. MMN_5]|jgi:hypothetical protein|nr:hypothetical protein CN934_19285 [Ensifer sp. MMN_5]PND28011.1 hypothetical protein CN933_07855 [Sinorhizobium sp. M4_45]
MISAYNKAKLAAAGFNGRELETASGQLELRAENGWRPFLTFGHRLYQRRNQKSTGPRSPTEISETDVKLPR